MIHKEYCANKKDGNSNSIEAAAAKEIWQRSKEGKLHYTTMLSDGDSKAFDAVVTMVER